MTPSHWNREPPSGFQGLHPDKPLTVYNRHLPHWRQDGATYFVTFRLNDSLPGSKLRELEAIKEEWRVKHKPPYSKQAQEDLAREVMRRTDAWLDCGMGSCLLREAEAARCVAEALHHFDGNRYELDAYVVMPNHVHVLVRPLMPLAYPLESLLQSWKRHSSQAINKQMTLGGNHWQDESFDRIVRDEEHLDRCIQYIGNNPTKAGLSPDACPMWVRPAWVEPGWGFEGKAQDAVGGIARPPTSGRTD